ncbi:MAG: hypothetical protein QG670_896, partial [Thermoproteota archaeon]|nr:hypothetical protein [Thermoproteota archaeon]
SESTQNKLKDMERINLEVLEMKKDIQSIKTILVKLSKIVTSQY